MSLTPGTRLGVYDITAPIGEGGMGQVWRATDSTLGRQVAIKILPDAFASDPERLARFEREAKTLASLNHPHIAAIYGFEKSSGMHALVMELVEGEDLSQRIARGAIPLDEALPIAKQIAEALEAAHEQGIIHRDLKPANIKLRADGTVKVLDFGLAKAMEPGSGIGDPGSAHQANSPTITSPAHLRQGYGAAGTEAGMILGTAAYMSPEQAAGKLVDKRSDLWALGVVLLEMLTGRQVFTGETVSHVMAAVLKTDPDWTALPTETPATIRRLLRRCLEKDRKRRLADASDARLDLEEAMVGPSAPVMTPAVAPARRRSSVLPWTLFGVTAVVAVALLARGATAPATGPPLVSRALIDFPQFAFSGARLGNLFALSPDGTRLVFAGNPDGKNKLYLRPLDQFEATAIPGTEEGSQPFFSPDGSSIGFFSGGKLKKVSLAGGSPVTLADAPNPTGGSWGADDTIIFGPDLRGLMKTSSAGAPPQRVTERQSASGLHGAPLLLPGGKAVVFTNSESSQVTPAVDVVSLETGEVTRLISDGCCAAYATTGHLVYAHATSGTIFAAPFDPRRPTVVGESARVMDGVMAGGLNGGQFATSLSGSLVYLTNSAVNERTFVWVDRAGRNTTIDFVKRTYGLPSLSPDGRRVATAVYDGLNPKELWVGDLDRGTMNRLIGDGVLNAAPIWSPDGSRVAFTSRRDGTVQSLYWVPADGGGVERLTTGEFAQVVQDWSPDGKTLVFYEINSTSGYDLRTLTLDRERTVKPLVVTPFNEIGARFSPDGRYLAYLSDRTGRQEVYVQPFPGPGEPRQVSTNGGTEAVWARNGRELFYRQGEKMMVVDVDVDFAPAFTASRPRLLFEGRYEVSFLITGQRFYDVSPDGRFLMVKSDTPTAPRQLHLVVNWFEELKRLVPVR